MSDRRRNRYTKGYREIAHDFLIMPTHSLPMPKPTKRFEREVRRVRYLSAWLFVNGQAGQRVSYFRRLIARREDRRSDAFGNTGPLRAGYFSKRRKAARMRSGVATWRDVGR